ncbi:hypothetical protein ACFQV8_16700 [Pseudonocardia benzenivorans]
MKTEYDAIVAAGFALQIDAPDLGMGRHNKFKDLSDADFLKRAEVQVEVLNHALRDVPADQVRMHLCWGNYEGPHTFDVEVEKIADVVLGAKPSTLLCEAANPATATTGPAGRRRRSPTTRSSVPGSSTRRRTSSSTRAWSRSASCATPTSSAVNG